jgi:D-arabinose 1-dehydrogenase-like Zn-dependent alcohol dehydrogenase
VGKEVSQWQPKQRVAVGWHGGHCGHCESCRRGDFVTCKYAQVPGISYDGGYADYMIAPMEALALISEQLSAIETAPELDNKLLLDLVEDLTCLFHLLPL